MTKIGLTIEKIAREVSRELLREPAFKDELRRGHPLMPTFLLRKIDDDLWERVKDQHEKRDADSLSLRGVIIKLLELYADGKITISARRTS
jgi:hypothetical protein